MNHEDDARSGVPEVGASSDCEGRGDIAVGVRVGDASGQHARAVAQRAGPDEGKEGIGERAGQAVGCGTWVVVM